MTAPAPGTRVRLVHMFDEYTKLRPGDEGTVTLVDALGTIHVRWDSGSNLGLIPELDQWDVLSPGPGSLPTTTT